MVDIEISRSGQHLVRSRRADNGDGVSFGAMGLNKTAGFRINQPGYFFAKQFFTVFNVVRFRTTSEILSMHGHQCRKAHIAHSKARERAREFNKLFGR